MYQILDRNLTVIEKTMSSDEVLGRLFLIISIVVFSWIVTQFLLYIIPVPEFLEIIFGVFINFNLIWFIVLPVFLIFSVYFVWKDKKRGIPALLLNITTCLLFFNGDTVLRIIQ